MTGHRFQQPPFPDEKTETQGGKGKAQILYPVLGALHLASVDGFSFKLVEMMCQDQSPGLLTPGPDLLLNKLQVGQI